MVAAVIAVGGAALKIGDAVLQDRGIAEAGRPFDPGELVFGGVANRVASACCEAPSTLTAKWLAFWNTLMLCEKITRLHSTSGGLSDTEANELQVSPYGLPSAAAAVITVTPVA